MRAPEAMGPWDATSVWSGGFIASADVRRVQSTPGRAQVWVRTDVSLLDGESISPLARLAGLLDITNGMSVRADLAKISFPNVDLTARLVREPVGEWIGFDTTVTFGHQGTGPTSNVVHDKPGPIGVTAEDTNRPDGAMAPLSGVAIDADRGGGREATVRPVMGAGLKH